MKKLFAFAFFFLPLVALAQLDLTVYKASNGKTYYPGDTVKLGRGSSPQGNFRYLEIGGWGKYAFANTNRGTDQYNADRVHGGNNAIIKRIITQTKHAGAEEIVFVVGVGAATNYNLYIESAIATCEIADCVNPTAAPAFSVADELLKFKKLLETGAITQAEYDTQKKKLLGE